MSNNYQAPVGGASSLFAQLSHLLDHLVAEDLSPDAILEALTSQVQLLLPSLSEVDRDVVACHVLENARDNRQTRLAHQRAFTSNVIAFPTASARKSESIFGKHDA